MKIDVLSDCDSIISNIEAELASVRDELNNVGIDKKPMSALEASELAMDHIKEATKKLGELRKSTGAVQTSLRIAIRRTGGDLDE